VTKHFVVGLGVVLGLVMTTAAAQTPAGAIDRLNTGRGGLVVAGYDVVAYFTDGRPVRGVPEHEMVWKGARWRFASREHRDLFARSPERYAPQYGGFCAYAVSRNYTATIDPEAWFIVEGRLFLNYSTGVRERWLAERDLNIKRGDANWPALSRKP
jgi:hypothetical protein